MPEQPPVTPHPETDRPESFAEPPHPPTPGRLLVAQPDSTFADEAARAAWQRMQQRARQRIVLHSGWQVRHENRWLTIAATELAHAISHQGGVHLTTFQGGQYAWIGSLRELVEQVDCYQFFQANRGVLVAWASVTTAESIGQGRLQVQLQPAVMHPVIVPAARAEAFLAWLGR